MGSKSSHVMRIINRGHRNTYALPSFNDLSSTSASRRPRVLKILPFISSHRHSFNHPGSILSQSRCHISLVPSKSQFRSLDGHVSTNQNQVIETLNEQCPSIDLVECSTEALEKTEDPNRKVSVYIAGSLLQMKAIDLYKAIRRFSSDEVLLLVDASHEQLDKTHLCLSLKRLFTLSSSIERQSGNRELVSSIAKDSRFQMLCLLITQKMKYLESSVACDMTNFMCYFGYDSSHPCMIRHLELSLHFINDLMIDQLVQLAHNVLIMSSTKQTQLLTKAIKVLCQSRFDQINTLTVWHTITLVDLFGNELPYARQLLNYLWRERDLLQTNDCVRLLKSMSKQSLRHRAFEQFLLDSVDADVDALNTSDVLEIIDSCHSLDFYSDSLFHRLGTKTISKMTEKSLTEADDDDDDVRLIFSRLADRDFIHRQLSSGIVNNLRENRLEIVRLPLLSTVKLINQLTDGDVFKSKEEFIEIGLYSWLEKNVDTIVDQLSPVELLDFYLSLVSLGEEPNKVLFQKLFSSEHLQNFAVAVDGPITVAEKLLLLLNDKMMKQQDFDTTLLDQLKELNRRRSTRSFSLPLFSTFVSQLWPNAIQGYFTETGLYVDYLLQCHNQKRIALICFPSHYFWRNSGQLKSSVPKLFVKCIQKDGYDVVPIYSHKWMKTMEWERLDYLKYRVNHSHQHQDLVIW